MVGLGPVCDVENYRRLRNPPVYDPELDVVLEDAEGSFLAYCIGWLDVARPLRTGRQPSQFHGTWICTRRDDRGHAQDASARDAYGAGRHRER